MLRRAAGLVLGLFFLSLPAVAAGRQDQPQEPTFTEEIDVSLSSMVVRVVDTWGRPILGLKPEDFRVRVGKKEIPVVAIDWIGEGESPVPAEELAEEPAAEAVTALPPAPARLVVIFVQADLTPSRISGQLRLRPFTRELLATLRPEDRVAVVSYDSHLKLWQDFTSDRVATHAAVDQAMVFSHETPVAPGDPVSLADHYDRAAARDAASPERALEIMAKALAPLPGEKTVIFLGWGFGSFDRHGVQMTPGYKPAVQALRAAHASVFVLDVTSADSHSLQIGLEGIAEATGGLYLATYRLPGLATQVLARTISGYYVLTLDRSLLSEEPGDLRIDLRDKSGTVLARPVALR
jgi:VWFA-related protein